jgi:uncharacterized membrane protein YdbT with pleckstrin-like domain
MAAVAARVPQPVTAGPEQTLWHGTPSWLLLFGKIIRAFLAVVVMLLIYYFGYQFLAPYAMYVWIVIAAVIVWQVVAIIMAFARIRTTIYTVTNQRVIIETGLTTKKVEDIDLRYIDDTQFDQSFVNRMLGIGNVKIVSSDRTSPNYTLHGVPDPRGIRELIRANAYQVSQRQLFTRAT